MFRLIDLSHPFEHNMPVYPGDNPVRLLQDKFVLVDGFNSFILSTGMHSGTHLDAPLHFIVEGADISTITLDNFVGAGRLLDVRGESVIKYKPEYATIVSKGDIVLLRTDHSTVYKTKEYYKKHPVVDEKLADFFVDRKIKLLGIDLPSPDNYPYRIHIKLLENKIPIIENLTNLVELNDLESFEVVAFPLKIKAEACPLRVVARGKRGR